MYQAAIFSCSQRGKKTLPLPFITSPPAPQHIQSLSFLSSFMLAYLKSSLSRLRETKTVQRIGCRSVVGEMLHYWLSSRPLNQLFLFSITTVEETEFLRIRVFQNPLRLGSVTPRLSRHDSYYCILSTVYPAFLVSPSKLFNFHSTNWWLGLVQSLLVTLGLLSSNSCPSRIHRQQILQNFMKCNKKVMVCTTKECHLKWYLCLWHITLP